MNNKYNIITQMYTSPTKITNWKTLPDLQRSTNILSSSRMKEPSINSHRSVSNSHQIKIKAKLSFGVTRKQYNHQRTHTQPIQAQPNLQHKLINLLQKSIKKSDIDDMIKGINVRKSTQQHKTIQAYSVSTVKGRNTLINNHQVSIFLGEVKHVMLIEGYRGNYAATYINKQLPLELIRRYQQNHKNNYTEDLGITLKQVYQQCNNKLSQEQKQRRDTSGCSVISVIITKDSIYVGNCGVSQGYCFTNMKSMMKLSKSHDTKTHNKQTESS